MSPGFTPEKRIHHRHLHRLGTDRIDRLRPAAPCNPLIAVGIEDAKSQKAFGGHCGEK
jgi:hypothetical protein